MFFNFFVYVHLKEDNNEKRGEREGQEMKRKENGSRRDKR